MNGGSVQQWLNRLNKVAGGPLEGHSVLRRVRHNPQREAGDPGTSRQPQNMSALPPNGVGREFHRRRHKDPS